jgi:RNA polymerase sigma-70 factor (ECF subfamily)
LRQSAVEDGTASAAKLAKHGSGEEAAGKRCFFKNPPHLAHVDESSTVNVESMSSADRKQCTTEWTDEELILEYRVSRDQSLFSILVLRYERELYSYLRRYLGRADWAEDAFQATFLQLHLKCDQFEEGRRLKPWLYMIATNKAIDLQRRQKRHQIVSLDTAGRNADGDAPRLVDLVEGNEPSALFKLNRSEAGDWVQNAIDRLPEHLSLVVNLVYYQGLKYREAADVLEIPVGTVKSRLHAAIGKLTEAWDETHDYRE